MRKFYAHDAIVVTDPIIVECCNNDIIATGERGRVVDVDPETKDVCVRLSSYHPELHPMRNMIYLPAADAHCHLQRYKPPSKSFDYIRLGFGVATAAILIMVAAPYHHAAAGPRLTNAVSCELPVEATKVENVKVKPVTAKDSPEWVDLTN